MTGCARVTSISPGSLSRTDCLTNPLFPNPVLAEGILDRLVSTGDPVVR